MRGLIFAGLLACAHGLGDTQPYTNEQDHSFAAFGAGQWQLQTCITGTKQSPIDIVQTAATVQKPDVGAIMSTGFDTNQPINWRVNGRSATAAVTFHTAIEAQLRTPAFITGGPLDERLVHLIIIFIFVLVKSIFSATSSPTWSSTGIKQLVRWVASIQLTG